MIIDEAVNTFFIDFDGTLVDSIPILKGVYFGFLETRGQKGNEEEFEELNGRTVEEIATILKERYQLEGTPEELMREYDDLFNSKYLTDVRLFPGAKECIEKAIRKNYRIFIVTSATKDLVLSCIERFDLLGVVEDIICGDTLRRGKPEPDIYWQALDVAQSKPENVIVIEDAYNGILASLAAHLTTISLFRHYPEITDARYFYLQDWYALKDLLS